MGDVGDYWRDAKEHRREERDKHTIECPGCPPNRSATRLWPGQTCRVCGYTDPRKKGEKARRRNKGADITKVTPSWDIPY